MIELRRRTRLRFKQHGVAVELDTYEGVFSAAALDPGTRLLLRVLADPAVRGDGPVVDLGCGYGPLGLWLVAADPGRTALLVDRDALAVEAASRNAGLNGLDDRIRTAPSLGWDDVDAGPVGLVVSNLPAKVGEAALRHLVLDGRHRLRPGGSIAVVAVERIAGTVAELLGEGGGAETARLGARGYLAIAARFPDPPPAPPVDTGFDRGVYGRGRARFRGADVTWTIDTSRTLPEFDRLGHGTEAACRLLPAFLGSLSPDAPVTVVGVGQGHLPVAARLIDSDRQLRLVDRDLLALRTATANLARFAARPEAALHLAAPGGLAGAAGAVVALPEKEPVAVTAAELGAALRERAPAGGSPPLPRRRPVLLHGRLADLRRVLELLPRHGVTVTPRAEVGVGRHAAAVVDVAPGSGRSEPSKHPP